MLGKKREAQTLQCRGYAETLRQSDRHDIALSFA